MATASAYFPTYGLLVGNAGGALESLPQSGVNGGVQRVYGGTLTLASQVSGTVLGVCRIPLGSTIVAMTVIVSATLGSSTIALGDANSSTLYMAASTFTSANTPTRVGNAAIHMSPITSGYDGTTGLASTSYEDILLTTGVATLPSSGTLTIVVETTLT